MHREPTMSVGGVIKGEAPPNRGGVREVSQHTFKQITTPHNMQMLQNHAGAQKSMGAYGGVYTPGGHTNILGGIQTYGGIQMWGCPNTPKYKNMPTTKK